MATISENLQALNEVKNAIKTAIENKGQDLTNVPFTQYAEKIGAINGANGNTISLQNWLNRNKRADYMFSTFDSNKWTQAEIDYYISNLDFSEVESFVDMFFNSIVETVLFFDTSKAKEMRYLYANCENLISVPLLDSKNATTFGSMHFVNKKLKVVPAYDMRSATSVSAMFSGCSLVEEIWIRNIKTSITVGSGSSYGHLLTLESLIHLIKELRDTGSMNTLTVGTVNLGKLANVYVRTIEITNEMRAEDDLIDEKLPFEVCESTDTGAILITDYVNYKNWQIQ